MYHPYHSDKPSEVEEAARWMLEQNRFIMADEIDAAMLTRVRRSTRVTCELKKMTVKFGRDTRNVWAVKVVAIQPRADKPRPIVGVCASGKLAGALVEFDSVRQAETIGGFDQPDIRLAMAGGRKHRYSQGYYWFDRSEVYGERS